MSIGAGALVREVVWYMVEYMVRTWLLHADHALQMYYFIIVRPIHISKRGRSPKGKKEKKKQQAFN